MFSKLIAFVSIIAAATDAHPNTQYLRASHRPATERATIDMKYSPPPTSTHPMCHNPYYSLKTYISQPKRAPVTQLLLPAPPQQLLLPAPSQFILTGLSSSYSNKSIVLW